MQDAGDIGLDNNLEVLEVSGQPGDIIDIPVIVTVPPNCSVNAYLDVDTPVNLTALMTVHHIEVVSIRDEEERLLRKEFINDTK